MSWRIAADVREIFVEVGAYSTDAKSFYQIRTLNRKDQLISGLTEALNLLPSEVKTNTDTKIWLTSDFERVAVREVWGSGCAFVTSEGFEDLLHIGDGRRQNLFALHARRHSPLIAHDQAFGLTERTHKNGDVEKKPSFEEISNLVAKLKLAEIKTVALCFLHSKVNPENEKFVAEALKNEGLAVYCSFEENGHERERAKRICEKAFTHLGQEAFRESLETFFKPENIFIKSGRPIINSPMPQHTLHVEFLEDRIICHMKNSPSYEMKTTPLSSIGFEDGGFVHIGKPIESEPGPVVLGKGIKLCIFDLISLKTKLTVNESGKLKIDIARAQKLLAPAAKNLRIDIETCVEKYISLFQEKLALEIETIALRNATPPLFVATGFFAQSLAPSLARRLGIRKIFIPNNAAFSSANLLLEEKILFKSAEALKLGDLTAEVPGSLNEEEIHDL